MIAVLAWIVCAAWAIVLLDRRRSWPVEQFLRRPHGPPAEPVPEVVAIVPARDEADVLPETLPALLAQDHPRFRVVLVDDRSGDGTGAAARALAAGAGRTDRLTVVEGSPPPPGWTGKVNALRVGLDAAGFGTGSITAAGPSWVLFTDADIRHPPDSVRALLDEAVRGGKDLVSVMARLKADGFWARLLIPPFVFFFQLLYPFRLASSPRSRVAAAAGGCVLLRAETLRSAGGIAAIASEIIDDVALARAVRRSGGQGWIGFDPEIASVRGYPALSEIWRMVARTAFVQLRCRWDLLALTAAALALFLVAPPFLSAGALFAGDHFSAAAAAAGWLIPAAMVSPSARHHRVPRGYALLLPLASALYLLMTLSSAWNHLIGRGPSWKGRTYGKSKGEGPGENAGNPERSPKVLL